MFNDRTGDHPVLRAVAISLILCMTIVANAADARYVTQASTGITNDPPPETTVTSPDTVSG